MLGGGNEMKLAYEFDDEKPRLIPVQHNNKKEG